MKTLVFKSAIDWWLYVAIVVSLLGVAIVAVQLASSASIEVTAFLVVVAILTAGLLLWPLLATTYSVDEDASKVNCGPSRWHIARADVVRVSPSRSVLSSPALSLDRLEIVYGNGRSLLISPKDKPAFLRALNLNQTKIGASSVRNELLRGTGQVVTMINLRGTASGPA
jgi:hypothetical protein